MRARCRSNTRRSNGPSSSASSGPHTHSETVQTRLTPSPGTRADGAGEHSLSRARKAVLADFFDPDCITVASDSYNPPPPAQHQHQHQHKRKQMAAGRARAAAGRASSRKLPPRCSAMPSLPAVRDNFVDTQIREADLRLFQEGKHYDATIVAAGKAFRVHKDIVLARCPYFKRCFKNVFSNGNDNCLTLNWGPDILEIGLTFIYAGNLPEPLAALHRDNFRAQVNLWYLGCVLEMPAMRALAMAYMRNLCAALIRGILAYTARRSVEDDDDQRNDVGHGYYHTKNRLSTSAADIADLTDAIRGAYTFDVHPQPPNELTDLLVDFVYAGRDLFFPDNAACNALLEDVPLFGAHLCQRMLGVQPPGWDPLGRGSAVQEDGND